MDTENKREIISQLVTKIVEELNEYFQFTEEELDILIEDIFNSVRKLAERRMV